MPSLKTAFRYLVTMGALGLVVNPILMGVYIFSFGGWLDNLIVTAIFGLVYFGQMCSFVILLHLAAQSEEALSEDSNTQTQTQSESTKLETQTPSGEVTAAHEEVTAAHEEITVAHGEITVAQYAFLAFAVVVVLAILIVIGS